MKLTEYLEVCKTNKFLIKVASGDKIINMQEFKKDDLINNRYADYPVKEIIGNIITLDATKLNKYLCVFNAAGEEHELVVEAFDKDEAELRGKYWVFKQLLFKGNLIVEANEDTVSPGSIKLVDIKKA